MAVEALAAQGNEQLARLHRPRIGRDAFENGVAAARPPFSPSRRRLARSSSLSSHRHGGAGRRRVGERQPLAGDFLVVLVALAGNQDDVV
jgi:hypothetical protein